MKKLSLILAVLMLAFALFACEPEGENDHVVQKGVVWTDDKADKDLVGAWQLLDEPDSEIRIFTNDCKIQFVKGAVYIEGNARYGIDSDGTPKIMSDFNYMSGEFNYRIDGNRALFVSTEGVTQTLVRVSYTAPELKKYEDFDAKNQLIGIWECKEYNDAYAFNADGTAQYSLNDTENASLYIANYTYNVKDGKVYLTSDAGEGATEDVLEFSIKDNTLEIGGNGGYLKK